MWIVVVFGDKRKHSDVVGPYADIREAEHVAEQLWERDGTEAHAFRVQTVEEYSAWLTGGLNS